MKEYEYFTQKIEEVKEQVEVVTKKAHSFMRIGFKSNN